MVETKIISVKLTFILWCPEFDKIPMLFLKNCKKCGLFEGCKYDFDNEFIFMTLSRCILARCCQVERFKHFQPLKVYNDLNIRLILLKKYQIKWYIVKVLLFTIKLTGLVCFKCTNIA